MSPSSKSSRVLSVMCTCLSPKQPNSVLILQELDRCWKLGPREILNIHIHPDLCTGPIWIIVPWWHRFVSLSVKVNVKSGRRVARRPPNVVYVSRTCRLRHRIGRTVRGHGMGSVALTTPRPEVPHISRVRRTSSMQAIKVIVFVSCFFFKEVYFNTCYLMDSFIFPETKTCDSVIILREKKCKTNNCAVYNNM